MLGQMGQETHFQRQLLYLKVRGSGKCSVFVTGVTITDITTRCICMYTKVEYLTCRTKEILILYRKQRKTQRYEVVIYHGNRARLRQIIALLVTSVCELTTVKSLKVAVWWDALPAG